MTDEFDAGSERQPTVSKSAEHAPIWREDREWMARYWARERMATRCQEDGFPEVAEAYRRGDRDEFLRDDIEAYLAGAAASADREEELEARVAELEGALREVADDLEAEIKARAGNDLPRRVERDLEPVSRARALLKEGDQ